MRLRRRPPEPPSNVRLITNAGLELPVQVTYLGRRGRIHEWETTPHWPTYDVETITGHIPDGAILILNVGDEEL